MPLPLYIALIVVVCIAIGYGIARVQFWLEDKPAPPPTTFVKGRRHG